MNQISRRTFVKHGTIFTVGTAIFPLQGFSSDFRKLRFGLMTDTHYADRPSKGTRFYKDALMKMDEAVEVFNKENLDFIMHLGDFKDEDEKRKKKDTLKYLKTLEAHYKKFKGPRYHCVGNHDVDSITKEEFLSHINNTNIESNRSYYSFTISGVKCIVLDANYDSEGIDHFYLEGANWQDTNIITEQIKWLEEELKESNLPTIVFCHHPLFEFFRDGKKYHINNYKEIQDILQVSPSVIACFHGHVHEERYFKINDIHFITQLGQVDYKGLENNSFSIVEIGTKSIKIHGYKRSSNKALVI